MTKKLNKNKKAAAATVEVTKKDIQSESKKLHKTKKVEEEIIDDSSMSSIEEDIGPSSS